MNISKELVRRGHSVTIFTSDMENITTRNQYEIRELSGIRIRYFRNMGKPVSQFSRILVTPGMIRALGKEISDYDVVHLHDARSLQHIFVHMYAKKKHVPYILQAHGSIPLMFTKKYSKLLYDNVLGKTIFLDATKVIALNEVERKQYEDFGVSKEKIEIIPNGIDFSEYAVLPKKGLFREKLGIGNSEKIVLYLGRIHKVKGIDVLVKAFSNIVEKVNDVKLVIAGPDDGYLDEVKALIEALDISDSVLSVGPQYGYDKLSAYVDADIYVLPSRYETFPLVVLEAYICGKPVVASKVLGLKELIINNETGLLFESESSEQLAIRILDLLNNSHRAEKMGLQGKAFVEKNFAIENVVSNLERVYEKAKGQRSAMIGISG